MLGTRMVSIWFEWKIIPLKFCIDRVALCAISLQFAFGEILVAYVGGYGCLLRQ